MWSVSAPASRILIRPNTSRAAAHRAIDEGRTRYTPVPGHAFPAQDDRGEISQGQRPCLRRFADHRLQRRQAVPLYGPERAGQTMATRVLIPSPYWVSYPEMVKMVGGTPRCSCPATTRMASSFAPRRSKSAASRTRPRRSSSTAPATPTGCVIPRATLEKIAELAVQKAVLRHLRRDL